MDVTDDGFGTENSTDWADQKFFPESQAEEIMVKIATPCILAVGTFGNIATICVMRRIKDHNSSQHAILMTLAVSDYLLVQTGMLRRLLQYYFHIDMRLWHWLVCKLYNWLIYFTGMLSAWLVTCVTVQRAMCITWPHKMRAVCTLRRTWIAVGSLVVTACLVNFHIFVWMTISSSKVCEPATEEYEVFQAMWTWVDMLLASVAPALCQIVCDVILCKALFKAASMSEAAQASSGDDAEHHGESRRKTASSVAVLCLALSCTFFVLTLPICIYLVWFHVVPWDWTPQLRAEQKPIRSFVTLLWYSNSAVNFFLYCVTGTRFRQEFVNWICCRSQRHSTACVGDVDAGTVKATPPVRY